MPKKIERPLRIATLRAAKRGDAAAQQAILDHFDAYISALSTINLDFEEGGTRKLIDEDIKIQIQAKLLASLDSFDLEGIYQKHLKDKQE